MKSITSDKAVILTIGNEILSGKTVDTNMAFIARELETIGIRALRALSVRDTKEEIQWAVKEACSAADIVICTGGLGPTHDDITKRAAADYFGAELQVDREQLRIVEEKFKALGYAKMPESNISQAEIPEGAVVFPNDRGTAPGLLLIEDGVHFFMVPGVPAEMEGLIRSSIIPYLRNNLDRLEVVISRTIKTTGIGESKLAEMLKSVLEGLSDPEVAFLPDPTGVDVRLTSRGKSEKSVIKKIKVIEEKILTIAAYYVFGYDDDTLGSVVGERLIQAGLTLAIAESCTGGLIGDRITGSSGSSRYFDRGVISYSNESKIDLLGVDPDVLKKKGAVSEEIAHQMAEGIRARSGCGMGLSATGIAGPTGGSPEKPVGLVYIGISDKFGTEVKKLQLRGSRSRVKAQAAQAALNLIRLRLNDQNFYRN